MGEETANKLIEALEISIENQRILMYSLILGMEPESHQYQMLNRRIEFLDRRKHNG